MVSFIARDESEFSPAGKIGSSAGVEIVSSGEVLHIKVAGKLKPMSSSAVAVAVERQVRQYGRVCVLLEIHDHRGRKVIAQWQDVTRNFKVQAIDHAKLDEAKIWLERQVASCADAT